MDLRLFQARWQLEDIPPERVHEEATLLLQSGLESPSLIELAGTMGASSRGEIEPVVLKALTELDAAEISDAHARWVLAFDVARKIVEGTITPETGATKLWGLASDLGLPGQPLNYFVYLGADYGDGPLWSADDTAWFDARIRETASELLDQEEAILARVRHAV
jgi:hypothetical protein